MANRNFIDLRAFGRCLAVVLATDRQAQSSSDSQVICEGFDYSYKLF
jgi:hypothetical protein